MHNVLNPNGIALCYMYGFPNCTLIGWFGQIVAHDFQCNVTGEVRLTNQIIALHHFRVAHNVHRGRSNTAECDDN